MAESLPLTPMLGPWEELVGATIRTGTRGNTHVGRPFQHPVAAQGASEAAPVAARWPVLIAMGCGSAEATVGPVRA